MDDSWRAQIEAATLEAEPYPALHAIAKSRRDLGVPQVALYHLFAGLQEMHENDKDERFYDAVVEVLDDIWHGRDLYNKRLTNEDVKVA